MSKLNLPLLFTVLVLWLVGGTWWFYKYYNSPTSRNTSDCSFPFEVADENFKTSSEKIFFFEISDWQPIIPSQTLASFKSIALYLFNNNEKKLLLNGRYLEFEDNNSDFINNGIARANAIKKELVDYGAPEEQIEIKSTLDNQLSIACGKIFGNVDFSFSASKALQNNPQNSIGEKVKLEESPTTQNQLPKVFTIFYQKNETVPKVDQKLDTYFRQLTDYFSRFPNAKLTLTGYTDNIGVAEKNVRMGKYRARKLRDLIIDYGVSKNRILTDSKGAKNPIATNKTEMGRNKNRRVVIRIEE